MNDIALVNINMDNNGNPTDGRGDWQQFLCRACGWIYDEKLGDPDSGLPAGTRFADIPEDWFCPLCGVTKRDFEPYQTRNIINLPNQCPLSTGGLIIIGAGLAGWAMVEAIRNLDDNYPITLITADNGDRYLKPLLSVAISQEKTIEKGLIQQTGEEASRTLHVHLIANTFVTRIDSQNKYVYTTRGDFNYNNLVLAIGAKPALPSHLPADMVWHINHLQMFSKLQNKLSQKNNQRVAIIGAGMIGTEFAEDLANSGHQVILFDKNNTPLAELLPEQAGLRIQQALHTAGVEFLGGQHIETIQKINQQYQINSFDCQTKQKFTCLVDMVIASTGLIIDERLPKRAKIDYQLNQGIIINPKTLQTSQANIYAMGDCIAITGEACRFVAPLQQQAKTIAQNILKFDKPISYQHELPVIKLKTKAISVTITGLVKAKANWQVVIDNEQQLYLEKRQKGQTIATAKLNK